MSIKLPSYLITATGEKYTLVQQCSRSVFSARNVTYDEDSREVAIKFESIDANHPCLHARTQAYEALVGGPGIPFIHHRGTTKTCNYIVMDLLGPSLEALLKLCFQRFTLKTILLIALQGLCRLEYIHSQSCAHGNITPRNLVIGREKFGNQIYVINPGISKNRGTDKESKTLVHTDLLSFGYVLLHFAWPELLWGDLRSKPIQTLCKRLPKEFSTYFNYANSLRADEMPCYPFLRNIFHNLYLDKGFLSDYLFDWTIVKCQVWNKDMTPPTPEGLETEFESIYAGLFLAEARCVSIYQNDIPKLNGQQFIALTTLHRVLLYEFYDIFSVSHHPLAGSSLPEVISQHKLAIRVWSNGIRPFIDTFRARFPESRSGFLSFLYFSYSMMAVFYETIPKPKAVWIECLYQLSLAFREVFREVDTKATEVWVRRIQYWSLLRDPAASCILQDEVTGAMVPDAFLGSRLKLNQHGGGKNLLVTASSQKNSDGKGLAEKDALFKDVFKRLLSQHLMPVKNCRDILLAGVSSFVTSCYLIRYESQHYSPYDQYSAPYFLGYIPIISNTVFRCSCILFYWILVSFYRAQPGKHHTHTFLYAGILGGLVGFAAGISPRVIFLGVIPWSLWLGMILISVRHWVKARDHGKSRCIEVV